MPIEPHLDDMQLQTQRFNRFPELISKPFHLVKIMERKKINVVEKTRLLIGGNDPCTQNNCKQEKICSILFYEHPRIIIFTMSSATE